MREKAIYYHGIEPELRGPTPRNVRVSKFAQNARRQMAKNTAYTLLFVVGLGLFGFCMDYSSGKGVATLLGMAAVAAIVGLLFLLVLTCFFFAGNQYHAARAHLLRYGVAATARVTRRYEVAGDDEMFWQIDFEFPVGAGKRTHSKALSLQDFEWYPVGTEFTILHDPQNVEKAQLYADLDVAPGEVMPASFDR